MIKVSWKTALDLLRKDPTYSGMFRMMERFADNTAAEVSDENDNVVSRTYGEYISMSRSACGVMEKKRPAGDIVGLSYDTCLDWPVLFWGILMSGHMPLLLNPASRSEQLNGILAEAGATSYVAASPIPGSPLEFIDAAEVLAGGEPGEERWGEYIALCTSGTTGSSRIFLYNARTIANHILSYDEARQVNPDIPFNDDRPCRLLAFLPFHHVFGFSVVYLLYACTGKVLVFCRDRSVQTILGTCRRHGVTHLYCVPIFFNALAAGIKKNLDGKKLNPIIRHIIKKKTLGTKIQCMITGGGHVPAGTLEILNDIGYPLCNGFGMTETGVITVERSVDPEQRKKGSIGEPFSLTEYRIGDGTSDEGELFLRGGALYTASMTDGKIVPRDESAWFATGDLVRKTPDGLFVCGRIKDVIINAGGENVYPDELEECFSGIAGVAGSCLLGVENKTGEEIAIVSRTAEGFDSKLYIEQIKKINESLPIGERVTRAFICSEELPVSGNMKVMRQKVRENLAGYEELPLSGAKEDAAEECASIPAAESGTNEKDPGEVKKEPGTDEKELSEIKEAVRGIISKTLEYTDKQKAALSDTDAFVEDLGMNSIHFFCCVAEIEERYGIIIQDTDIAKLTNIEKASNYIYGMLHSSGPGAPA